MYYQIPYFRVALMLLTVPLPIFFLILLWSFMASPSPNVDYVAEINAELAKATDVAAPHYRAAWLMQRDDKRLIDVLDDAVRSGSRPFIHETNSKEWPNAVVQLQSATELLDQLRSAGTKATSGFLFELDPSNYSETDRQALNIRPDPYAEEFKKCWPTFSADIYEKGLYGLWLPQVQQYYPSFRVLFADTRLAITEKDWQRALQNVVALDGISDHVVELKTDLTALFNFTMNSLMLDLIEEIVNAGASELTDSQLTQLQEIVNPNDMTWDRYFAHERLQFKDLIQRAYSRDSEGDGRLTVRGVRLLHETEEVLNWRSQFGTGSVKDPSTRWNLWYLANSVLMVLNNKNRQKVELAADEIYDSWRRNSDLSYNSGAFKEGVVQVHWMRQTRGDIFQLLEILDDGHEFYLQTRDCRQATEAAIAIIRFRKTEQRLPMSFDDLVGKYLSRAPRDHINDLPMKLVCSEDKFRIYSCGWDGIDNQGQCRETETYLEARMRELGEPIERDPSPPHPREYRGRTAYEFDDWNLWPRTTSKSD